VEYMHLLLYPSFTRPVFSWTCSRLGDLVEHRLKALSVTRDALVKQKSVYDDAPYLDITKFLTLTRDVIDPGSISLDLPTCLEELDIHCDASKLTRSLLEFLSFSLGKKFSPHFTELNLLFNIPREGFAHIIADQTKGGLELMRGPDGPTIAEIVTTLRDCGISIEVYALDGSTAAGGSPLQPGPLSRGVLERLIGRVRGGVRGGVKFYERLLLSSWATN
jgi:hypothetical protein